MLFEAWALLQGLSVATSLADSVVLPAIHRKVGGEALKKYEKDGDPIVLLRGRQSDVQTYINARIASCDAGAQEERDAAYNKADALFDRFKAQAEAYEVAAGRKKL